MAKPKTSSVGRRGFLKGAASGAAAALVSNPPGAAAQQAAPVRAAAPIPSASALAAEVGQVPPSVEVLTADHPGSDFMVDVIKSLGFEYIAPIPAPVSAGLHESIINYGGNKSSGIDHLLPRRIVGRHGRWLREDRRQAAWP